MENEVLKKLKEYGERLMKRRKNIFGWTEEEAALRAGIDRETIRRIEKPAQFHRSSYSMKSFLAYVDALGMADRVLGDPIQIPALIIYP